jgi:uncharacterized protein (DUF1684 family)
MIGRTFALLATAGVLLAMSTYESEILEWRHKRVAELTAEGGWLSLAGLFWLHDGANSFGKGDSNEIPLPDGPARAGVFEFHAGKVAVSMNGAPRRELKPDAGEAVRVGRLSLFVIKRGDKYGIRVKDPESEARRHFHGFEYFPISEEYRITAQWVAEPRQIPILNVLGQTEPSPSPGHAVFRLYGQEFKLYPILEEPDARELFFIFKDQTSGKETYPAGRFFYSAMPRDGKVVLDFNKAYNPPCAFTPYATCPLPPPENRLAVRIEAGERKYGNH